MTQEQGTQLPSDLDEIVTEAFNDEPLAGLAVGIVRNGELVYTREIGMADIAARRPVTQETAFRIGSISKTFTAIGLMQLWEQGKFQLDDPIGGYLKAYQVLPPGPDAPPITFRHLLTHTSGIGEVRGLGDLRRPVNGLGSPPDRPLPEPGDYYAGGLRAEVPAGTKWAYANHAFNTLGQLIADISGEPFADYMIRHVFTPLGMAHTDYLRGERVGDRLATGYTFKRGRLTAEKYLEIAVPAAGSIFSSVAEMRKYMAALLHGGAGENGAILKPETLAMMTEPQFQLDPHLPAMGLAFWLDSWDGHRIAGHDGGWPGFISSMLVAPGDGWGVVVFTNTSNPAPHYIAEGLLCRLLDLPPPVDSLPRPDVPEAPYLWPDLAGSYGPAPGLNTNARVWFVTGGELEVYVKDNHLAVRGILGPLRGGERLYPIDSADPLAFAFEFRKQLARVVFERDEAGRIIGLYTSFDHLYKRPPVQSLRRRAQAGLATGAGLVALGLVGLRLRRRK